MKKEIALVLPVAGLSSRFGGKIKQFASVGPNGETLVEYSLNQALSAGFNKIVFIVGEMTSGPFREKFGEDYKGIPVYYVKQEFDRESRDRPWGTTDALCCVKNIIDCPFVFCNGDDIYGASTFKKLVGHLSKSDALMSECGSVGYEIRNVLSEGGSVNRALFEVEDGHVKSIKEILDIRKENLEERALKEDSLCSMNCFALYPETVEMLSEILIKFKEEHKGDRKAECLLPNDLSALIKLGKIKMKIYSAEDKWYGVTNPGDEDVVREQLKSMGR